MRLTRLVERIAETSERIVGRFPVGTIGVGTAAGSGFHGIIERGTYTLEWIVLRFGLRRIRFSAYGSRSRLCGSVECRTKSLEGIILGFGLCLLLVDPGRGGGAGLEPPGVATTVSVSSKIPISVHWHG